jgi:hypothetical protein
MIFGGRTKASVSGRWLVHPGTGSGAENKPSNAMSASTASADRRPSILAF